MMSEKYEFDYNAADRLLRLKLNGLWDESVMVEFVRQAGALRKQVEDAGHRNDDGRILIDLTDYPIQPKNITDQIAALLPAFGDLAGRVAVVRSSSALQHLQIQRLLPLQKVRVFTAFPEAWDWLSVPKA